MKCNRCQKEVPVLTPSPDGDQDLCEECFSIVYHNKMGPSRTHKKAVLAGVIASAVVLGFVYWIFLRDPAEKTQGGDDKNQQNLSAQTGSPDEKRTRQPKRKKPVFKRNRTTNRTARKRNGSRTITTTSEEEKNEENTSGSTTETVEPGTNGESTETEEKTTGKSTEASETTEETTGETETQPANEKKPQPGLLETNTFSLLCQSAEVLRDAFVTVNGPDGEESIQIDSTGAALYELSCSFTPGEQNQIILSDISIACEGESFPLIQAKTQNTLYTANTTDQIELESGAKVVFHFEADQDGPEVFQGGEGIQEIAFWNSAVPQRLRLTLLFALPVDFPEEGRLKVGNTTIPLSL